MKTKRKQMKCSPISMCKWLALAIIWNAVA